MNNDTIAIHIQKMRSTEGFRILMERWNVVREGIIAEGKASRKDEKLVKMWAKLDGFDSAVAEIARLANLENAQVEDPQLEE